LRASNAYFGHLPLRGTAVSARPYQPQERATATALSGTLHR
jgi:hypothetical protein